MRFDGAAGNAWRGCRGRWTAGILIALMTSVGFGQEGGGLRRAGELMKNRQYNDAIRVLKQDVQGKGDEALVKQHLMLGECSYLTRQYDESRGFFVKAARHAGEQGDRAVADYRLACVAFRLKEFTAASERIDLYVSKNPGDARVGVLLTFKMHIAAQKGKGAQAEMEAIHKRIAGESRKYGAATVMEADEVLCDFYRSIGQDDKVLTLYTRIAMNNRQMIQEYEKDRQTVPPHLEKTHDNAALQLGALHLEKKQYGEATKWLENVRYDAELKVRARLLLAKMAYEKGDWSQVQGYLAEKNFLAAVPEGALKWDVYLLLGLAEKSRSDPNAGKIEEYLKQVGPQARGFAQAQLALGDVYREKGLADQALKAYANAIDSPDHAPGAMFWTAVLLIERAEKDGDVVRRVEQRKKGGAMLGELVRKYPLTAAAKQAKEKIAELVKQGIAIDTAGQDEMLGAWEKTAKDKPGTAEAAQALAQIIRVHARTIFDEKTKKISKGPDFEGVARAGDPLLNEKVYKGDGMDAGGWKAIRCEALYQRALAELASLAPSKELSAAGSKFVKNPSAARAIEWLKSAKDIVDPKQLDLVKGIDLALVEAMFKSDRAEDHETAEKRFAERENDYGNDPRFARLSVDLAEFYAAKGRLAEAAQQYAGVARRGRDLPAEDAVKLWFTAGQLFSRAAYETQQQKDRRDYAVMLSPREVIGIGGGDVLRTDPRFGREITINWPRGGQEIVARDALAAVSRASGISFIWPTTKGRESIASYLEEKRLNLKDGRYTVEQALGLVLDFKMHRLGWDIGLIEGAATLGRPAGEDAEAGQVVEIYDSRQELSRCRPLLKGYGNFRTVHNIGGGRRGEGGVLLFDVMARVEQLSGIRFAWAQGVDKQVKLGVELKEKDIGGSGDSSCAAILAAALEKVELRYRLIMRDLATKYYDDANRAFNEARKLDPTGKYAEKALFAVAVNCYNLREYSKMKEVLRTYLKLFDDPTNESYQQACFWIGYALENEKKMREAANYYARAAEERLVIVKAEEGKSISEESLRKLLSFDSQFSLAQPVRGTFKEMTLSQLADFFQINTHVSMRIDASAAPGDVKINREGFKDVPAIKVLVEELAKLGLSCRVENVNPAMAEKAYYRLAAVYRRDDLMDQALENCDLLLARYPNTERRRDVQRLKIDIYRGLKDYGKVLDVLVQLKKGTTDAAEQRDLDLELAAIRFDMADYDKAAAAYKSALGLARNPQEKLQFREAYARSLARLDKKEALAEYEAILKEETAPLPAFVDSMMVFLLKYAQGKALEREFPEDAFKYAMRYGNLSQIQRDSLTQAETVKAMWIYYVLGLIDADKKRYAEAAEKLTACMDSPDEILGGEAGLRLGLMHLERGDAEAAASSLQTLLLKTRSSESVVRGTYWLGVALSKLGKSKEAGERFEFILKRYPESPLAEKAKGMLNREGTKDAKEKRVEGWRLKLKGCGANELHHRGVQLLTLNLQELASVQ